MFSQSSTLYLLSPPSSLLSESVVESFSLLVLLDKLRPCSSLLVAFFLAALKPPKVALSAFICSLRSLVLLGSLFLGFTLPSSTLWPLGPRQTLFLLWSTGFSISLLCRFCQQWRLPLALTLSSFSRVSTVYFYHSFTCSIQVCNFLLVRPLLILLQRPPDELWRNLTLSLPMLILRMLSTIDRIDCQLTW